MLKFKQGFLIGAAAGLIYALFTAKRTGKQRQNAVRDYLNGLTNATQEVTQSANNLKKAAANLSAEVKTASEGTLQDLGQSFNDFQFEVNPRLEKLQDSTTKLQSDLERFTGPTE